MREESSVFINWLLEEKGISKKSAHDYASRLRRATQLLEKNELDVNALGELEKIDNFKTLSVSVKSQVRRTVRLYLEYHGKNLD